jgi:hypothetical protein
MKRLLPIITAIIILFASCKSASFFDTPNSLRNITGTLFLTNGRTVEGKLIINTDNMLGNAVKIYVEGEKDPQKFNLMDVEGYQIRGDYYELKEIKGTITIGKKHSFMKRLTPKDSRIHLYENTDDYTSTTTDRNGTTTSQKKYETQYYMQFPIETGDGVWAVNSSKFVPNFDEKMSKLVEDCPALSQKIANKESGYFYAQVSLFREKRADVLWNIISEYNKCK